MKQTSIMMSVPDVARADILLTEDRIYYHFATTDTVDEGELPGLKERYTVVEQRLRDAVKSTDTTDEPAVEDAMKVDIFIDNVRQSPASRRITEEALRRVVGELAIIDDAFGFLRGFLK